MCYDSVSLDYFPEGEFLNVQNLLINKFTSNYKRLKKLTSDLYFKILAFCELVLPMRLVFDLVSFHNFARKNLHFHRRQ